MYILNDTRIYKELIHLDTLLEEKWRGVLPEIKGDLVRQKGYNGNAYFLFQRATKNENSFEILVIESSKGYFSKFVINDFLPLYVTEFEVTSNSVLIGGYFAKVPVIIHYDFRTQTSRVLPGLFNEQGDLMQISVNLNGTFDVLMSVRTSDRQKSIWMIRYDANGNPYSNTLLDPEEKKNLIFGHLITGSDSARIIAGVYGRNKSDLSRGVFFATMESNGENSIQYYSFADLENFFSYMTEAREKRVKERIERRKVKGKRTKFNYRFLVHEFIPYGDNYILLGEAFYPSYNSEYFAGYVFTHAALMCFDAKGNLLWDNSFELNVDKSFVLDQHVRIAEQDNTLAMVYLFNNTIRSRIIKGDQILDNAEYNELIARNSGFWARNTVNLLDPWYGKYFYGAGLERILTQANGGTSATNVFFVRKINFK